MNQSGCFPCSRSAFRVIVHRTDPSTSPSVLLELLLAGIDRYSMREAAPEKGAADNTLLKRNSHRNRRLIKYELELAESIV